MWFVKQLTTELLIIQAEKKATQLRGRISSLSMNDGELGKEPPLNSLGTVLLQTCQ